MSEKFSSPRIAALQHDLDGGNSAALARFWANLVQSGAPLIEEADDDAERLVTFVWRGDARNVVLISEVVNGWWWNGFADSRLFRLERTDLWYRTHRVRADARFLYRLAPNHSLLHPLEVVDESAYRGLQRPDPLNPRRFTYPADPEVSSRVQEIWSLVDSVVMQVLRDSSCSARRGPPHPAGGAAPGPEGGEGWLGRGFRPSARVAASYAATHGCQPSDERSP